MMPIVLGVDLGTTKITSLALETDSNQILAVGTVANDANVTSEVDRRRGRSEWDASRIVSAGLTCLKQVAEQLGPRASHVCGIGITGQQHGMLLTNSQGDPISPLINWQDRRALDAVPGQESSWLDHARKLLGDDAWQRTGCRLQPGFMAVTLVWLKAHDLLPANSRAHFIMDHFGGMLAGIAASTEPSCAGSSGIFDVRSRQWDEQSISQLDLPRSLFPDVSEVNVPIGKLTSDLAAATGFPAGTPVYPAIGDHQASFLGSITDRQHSILVNVGTGAQVAVYTDGVHFVPPVELRPFPSRGNLLSNVGLAGGWSYQVLEQFFRDVGASMFELESSRPLYEQLNQMAESVSPGADGLCCEPLFAGTRLDPTIRGSITGLSPQNFTARHLARAVLEGMARSLRDGYRAIEQITGCPRTCLVAAGNGLRENRLLSQIVSQSFALPITFTSYREEPAYGAAVVARGGL
jgi:sugar (pentulose or hexulose) kinase